MKKKHRFKERIVYKLDLWMSKSTSSKLIVLFAITGIIVVILGIATWLITESKYSFGGSVWTIFMHTLDPGVVSGDEGSKGFLFIMVLATLAGVFFLALLIGFINDGIQRRIETFSQGREPVLEEGHTIILGFNESTMIIISELICANENQKKKRNVVVIMDDLDKHEMEEKIYTRFSNRGNLEIIVRSGSICRYSDLNRCSVKTAKSIIVAKEEDFENVKAILACTQLLNESPIESKGYVTAAINKKENERAAKIAGFDMEDGTTDVLGNTDRLELLLLEDEIARIMTHTCRQTGLSKAFIELFNYEGSEIYFVSEENYKDIASDIENKSIREINRHLQNGIAIGIMNEAGKIIIDNPNDVVFTRKSQLIVLQEDDNKLIYKKETNTVYEIPTAVFEEKPSNVLILGDNSKLSLIIREMTNYLNAGSQINVVSAGSTIEQNVFEQDKTRVFESGITLIINQQKDLYNSDNLSKILEDSKPEFIMILSSDKEEVEESDRRALELLLYVQEYRRNHPNIQFGVTCEMRSVDTQQLVEGTAACDFVISRNIGALMMAQISENRRLLDVFETLLNSNGFEVYLKPAKYYLEIGKEKNFYAIADAVAEKGEIFIGYMSGKDNRQEVIINPLKQIDDKDTELYLDEDMQIVVLAEDRFVGR